MPTEIPIQQTPLYFARVRLGLKPYDWQATILTWFERANIETVLGTVATPNESGKSSLVIPCLVLWWLAMHELGKVVVTTKSGLQLESQILPAIRRHASKFEGWIFNERRIVTPTGGEAVFFTTDEATRAEGHHPLVDKLTGPVLIIIDEAKSVDEEIFSAIDRCGFSALLYTSSPGRMAGRFYDSHYKQGSGFRRMRVGLKDCPHIEQSKIDRIIEEHGPDSPFTRSTLHGEFMEAEGELRFNREGLDKIRQGAEVFDRTWRRRAAEDPNLSLIGGLEVQPQGYQNAITWIPDLETGWLWQSEQHPTPGRLYIGFCDPMTGEQSEGSLKRDTHAAGILGLAYLDQSGDIPQMHDDEVVACLHHPDGCRWDNDILAERFAILLKYYGCPAIVEANNSGTEVMRLLQLYGCQLWRRQKRDHRVPGKLMETVGFQTNVATKSMWVGALGRAIREQTLVCNYLPAASQFGTFILNEKGAGEAQGGAFDDWVTGVGLGLFARSSATKHRVSALPSVGMVGQPSNGPRGAWM